MKDDLLRKLGEKIRSIRVARSLSQEELAELAKFHRTYIGMIERGEKNITILNLYKVANALRVNIKEFF